jgi:hypothetical protein
MGLNRDLIMANQTTYFIPHSAGGRSIIWFVIPTAS